MKKAFYESLEIFGGMFIFLIIYSLFFQDITLSVSGKLWLLLFFLIMFMGRYFFGKRREKKLSKN
ncbi:hypothetical protein [Listeria booriae]|uniref:Uncharacterized protein n=1 Tax=Listeria booriae TaxID=1552123 RepID=A0A7X1D695_9LIST|nr:hypothetical protein [Listeria booriae]MBC1974486.1 hypothetical protein [Listeria booriae]MBC1982371.1 hypothetical protein [Listeria booriae]MBC2022600.1 hypothetical protein [Listeria booriae]MBC2025803.1 hypothetical protein [Listeria booriae]MBC2034086.1 hypothetical protein [Listeria booriae]